MLYYIAKLIYGILGWTINREEALALWEEKNVLVGFPHTSMVDTLVTMVGLHLLGKKSRTFVKKEMFVWPLSWLLKVNHAVPVDRGKPGGIVGQIVDEFNRHEEYSVCIVPQGTRQAGSSLRTGFWHIAVQANATILCWYFDSHNKRVVCLGKVGPGSSMEEDLDKMQKLYDRVNYQLPRNG